ncbi:MAG TPA: prenyltransferase [Nocardioidaceae bacterium]|nr:prenyltransferase [Nocardioidaceae bacterium]
MTSVPSLPGILNQSQVRASAASIARVQEPSGAVPWFRGGHVDVWDHVECAMALLVGGQARAAERAYDWLFAAQRADGSWPVRLRGGRAEDPGTDTNLCAYVAVGVWHHWRVRGDRAFLERAWPVVRRALDLVVALQLPFGGISWARGATGPAAPTALLAGSASIFHALRCGLAIARELGGRHDCWSRWSTAASLLGHAVAVHEDRFEDRARYSMDWYYPVLAGAVRGKRARARLAAGADTFVVPGLGARCVADQPWVTAAETCELAMAHMAAGERAQAIRLLADVQHLRDDDGAYWTGYVYPDRARWPVEQSTWTAAAVLLAVDAVAAGTPGAGVLGGTDPQVALPEVEETGCGCPVTGPGRRPVPAPG